MFRGLFGSKSDRPQPPKGQIEVVCPACGAAQFEPRLVVSTFCRKCGVHLTVNRKQVTASTASRSGVGAASPEWEDAGPPTTRNLPRPPATSHMRRPYGSPPANGQDAPPAPPPAASAPPPAQEEEAGFGGFLQQSAQANAAEEEPAPSPPPTDEEPKTSSWARPPLGQRVSAASIARGGPLGGGSARQAEPAPVLYSDPSEKRPQSNSPPPTPTPEPMTASTLQKMKDQGMYRNQYFKDAECFDCGHKFKVSRSSRSAPCAQCGSLICLEDVEINMLSHESIRTRGDVLIRKRGHLVAESVVCKDLRCQGLMEANAQVAGDAIFRSTGTVSGEIQCRRFVIEKGAEVTFTHEIKAEEADVQGRITANIYCNGPLVIGASGAVNGDITVKSVSIDPGGELNGSMNIIRTQVMQRPKLTPDPEPTADGGA